MIDRRQFLETVGMAAAGTVVGSTVRADGCPKLSSSDSHPGIRGSKSFGSGHFGDWMEDEFGLPAYHYTCDQILDPKAISPVNKAWRSPTDHTHQVGNDRLVAAVSNFGYVQVRQDEGSPKFLNDYAAELGRYGGGIGYLSDGKNILSTYYPGNARTFERIFGVGYFRKKVSDGNYAIDQALFAPFGDDPLLISEVSITNRTKAPAHLNWVEYWGCQIYQFSYRSFMQAMAKGDGRKAAELRRKFGERFAHEFRALESKGGLVHTMRFLGRTPEDESAWAAVQAMLKANPTTFLGGPFEEPGNGATMEDLHPPSTFLASLDSPADGWGTDGKAFFGEGGVLNPAGLNNLAGDILSASGPESAMMLERHLHLGAGETRTLYFAYGYLPVGVKLNELLGKYREDLPGHWPRSSRAWKKDGLRLSVASHAWVERELTWHNYYLRSNSTFDDFFHEHILSQGHVYQYLMGFQGAARDPLQHALPFVFSNPQMVREVLRYTLKEALPDGTIPYGVVGHGMPMPVLLTASDMELWLLWLASEYVLATRDRAFLSEVIAASPSTELDSGKETIRVLLARCYRHVTEGVGTGRHGLMRLMMGDWNDGMVWGNVEPEQYPEVRRDGESILNAAMASYVLDHYARMLAYVGEDGPAADSRQKAEAQRQAVRAQWAGHWFRRCWLSQKLGWVGEDQLWLEPQPWSIIGGAATPEQTQQLLESLNREVRDPSPIGAMLQSKGENVDPASAGVLTNSGIWPSINGTLIWALALVDAKLAWDEWTMNSLARHAEIYPDVWYGIWSGPDCYNSALSRYPGQTFFEDPNAPKSSLGMGINWTDYPVMNMHPHAWPLYSAAKLVGVAFDEKGVDLQPALPFDAYQFASPLLGLKKSSTGYEGWYAPRAEGVWEIRLRPSKADANRLVSLEVNGSRKPIVRSASGVIAIKGPSTPTRPLRWSARF